MQEKEKKEKKELTQENKEENENKRQKENNTNKGGVHAGEFNKMTIAQKIKLTYTNYDQEGNKTLRYRIKENTTKNTNH